jgi:hypothetical protein
MSAVNPCLFHVVFPNNNDFVIFIDSTNNGTQIPHTTLLFQSSGAQLHMRPVVL